MFVTLNTWNKRQVFVHPKFAKKAIDYLYELQKKHAFAIHGFVVMPDHIHLLITVHAPSTITVLMHEYTAGLVFAVNIGAFLKDHYDLRLPQKPQDRLVYIHDKPFKAALCDNPKNYPWSSVTGTWPLSPLD